MWAGIVRKGWVVIAALALACSAASEPAEGTPDDDDEEPPPPPASVAECSAPQPGWVFCDDFETDRLSRYFEYNSASGAFVRATGVGRENSVGMRARFNAGQVGAGELHLALGKTPQAYMKPADARTAVYRQLYWRFYLRNQAGWTGGGGDKLTRAFVFASPSSWAQAMIAHVWSGGSSGPNSAYLFIDPARGTDASGTLVTTGYNDFANLTWLGAQQGARALFSGSDLGQWHCIEVQVKLNDAGVSNGETRVWINGTLDAERTGLNFLGNFSEYGLNAVYLENYWNNGSPVQQERYFDNFVVSTQRIGCL